MTARPALLAARLVALATAAALLLGPGGWPARGQEQAELGGYRLKARANGVTTFYDTEGLLPLGPLVEVTVPEATATLTAGPLGYALASLGYPGPIVADFNGIASEAQTGAVEGFDEGFEDSPVAPGFEDLARRTGRFPVPFPSYPIRTEARHPGGPTEEEDTSTVPGGRMHSLAEGPLSVAEARYPASGLRGVLQVGSAESRALTSAEGSPAVGEVRTVLSDVSLLGGIVTLDAVETELRAVSDGEEAGSEGSTVVQGLKVFGREAVLDAHGVRFAEAPDGEDSEGGDGSASGDGEAAVPPPDDPGLGEAVDAVDEGTRGLRDPLAAAVDEAGGSLTELLAQGGVTLELTEPHEQVSGATALRTSTGLRVRVDYDGREEPFAQLLDLVPADQIPRIGEDPASTTAVIGVLKAHHITRFDLAGASVEVAASPAFEPPPLPAFEPGGGSEVGSVARDGRLALPGSASAPAEQGSRRVVAEADGRDGLATLASGGDGRVAGRALPAAVLVALVLLSGPLFGTGATRLADALVAGGGERCPLERARIDGRASGGPRS